MAFKKRLKEKLKKIWDKYFSEEAVIKRREKRYKEEFKKDIEELKRWIREDWSGEPTDLRVVGQMFRLKLWKFKKEKKLSDEVVDEFLYTLYSIEKEYYKKLFEFSKNQIGEEEEFLVDISPITEEDIKRNIEIIQKSNIDPEKKELLIKGYLRLLASGKYKTRNMELKREEKREQEYIENFIKKEIENSPLNALVILAERMDIPSLFGREQDLIADKGEEIEEDIDL